MEEKYAYPLDEKTKKWYHSNMDNCNEINKNIAKNLIFYRKAIGLTQAELAEKINYSDKSISKWESGNGVPDVYTLVQLADLFGVSLDALVGSDEPKLNRPKSGRLHFLIMMLSCGLVWLVATCMFVLLLMMKIEHGAWLSFIYAVVLTSVVMIVYAGIWKYRMLSFISVSTLIWVTLTAVYLTGKVIASGNGYDYSGYWSLYLIVVPLQGLGILWVFFRSLFKKNKTKEAELVANNAQYDETKIANEEK